MGCYTNLSTFTFTFRHIQMALCGSCSVSKSIVLLSQVCNTAFNTGANDCCHRWYDTCSMGRRDGHDAAEFCQRYRCFNYVRIRQVRTIISIFIIFKNYFYYSRLFLARDACMEARYMLRRFSPSVSPSHSLTVIERLNSYQTAC